MMILHLRTTLTKFSWTKAQTRAITKIKRNIKHFEKHGVGNNAMISKSQLNKLQKRIKEAKEID